MSAVSDTIKAIASGTPQPQGAIPQSLGAGSAHTATAAILGDALAQCIIWPLETFAHVIPPAAFQTAIATVCVFVASFVMQKVSN